MISFWQQGVLCTPGLLRVWDLWYGQSRVYTRHHPAQVGMRHKTTGRGRFWTAVFPLISLFKSVFISEFLRTMHFLNCTCKSSAFWNLDESDKKNLTGHPTSSNFAKVLRMLPDLRMLIKRTFQTYRKSPFSNAEEIGPGQTPNRPNFPRRTQRKNFAGLLLKNLKKKKNIVQSISRVTRKAKAAQTQIWEFWWKSNPSWK